MKILGISGALNYNNHDAAAALVIDGTLINTYEEERFNRVKHSVNHTFPIISIHKLLTENNLCIDDIDVIATPFEPSLKDSYLKEVLSAIDSKYTHIPELVYKDHHFAHICDSVFQSGFSSCACLVVDGYGDNRDAITLAQYKDGKITILERYDYTKSLGLLYGELATCVFGLPEFSEGKLMGLAAYGIPNQDMPLYWEDDTIKTKCEFSMNDSLSPDDYCSLFSYYCKKYNYPFYIRALAKEDINLLHYVNTAASLQKCYNDIFYGLAEKLKRLTNEDNLILSGGCIQNCIGNNLVVESGLFKNIFAAPAPHDAGCAVGLAFCAAYELGEKIQNTRRKNSYIGQVYTDTDVLNSIDTNEFCIEEYSAQKLARLLEKDKLVAWFQGGSELGPRALGHRSLLGNPKNRENFLVLNNKIKQRENWRPLAPSVPAELFDLIFDVKSHDLTEFMLRTIPIKKEWQSKLPAVCHIDGTTRPQRLEKEQNPEFYELLMTFYNNSGIPCLINTSFNGREQPIVETPEQAMEFFKNTKALDLLVFNAKYIIKCK